MNCYYLFLYCDRGASNINLLNLHLRSSNLVFFNQIFWSFYGSSKVFFEILFYLFLYLFLLLTLSIRVVLFLGQGFRLVIIRLSFVVLLFFLWNILGRWMFLLHIGLLKMVVIWPSRTNQTNWFKRGSWLSNSLWIYHSSSLRGRLAVICRSIG